MISFNPLFAASLLVSGAFAASNASAFEAWNDWKVLSEGHTDVRTNYNSTTDEWSMQLDIGDFDVPGGGDEILRPDNTILLLTDAAKRTFDSDPPAQFSFLGQEGDSYYRIITTAEAGIPHLGFNGYGVEAGIFEGSQTGRFDVYLTDFSGPGDFFLYIGGPTILMDTTIPDGPPYGKELVRATGHDHQNWVFREPGIYLLEMTPSGTLAASGETTVGDPNTFFFLVDPTPVDWWRLDTFRETVKESRSDLMEDASGDGRPNVLAYAFGYDPAKAADPYLPRPEITEVDDQLHLSLIVRRPADDEGRADRSDLIYRPQVSHDLSEWTDLDPSDGVLWQEMSPDADGTPRYRLIDPEPITTADRKFIRLEVEFLDREE